MPMFFAFPSDSSLLVWDLASYRVTEFALTGETTALFPADGGGRPLSLVGDSLDVQDVMQRAAPRSGTRHPSRFDVDPTST